VEERKVVGLVGLMGVNVRLPSTLIGGGNKIVWKKV